MTKQAKHLLRARLALGAILGMAPIAASSIVNPSVADASGSPSSTLKFDFSFSMQSADPAVFFQDQGLSVTVGATYEQLIKEAPNGQPEPSLATSWKVSDNDTRITLQLRHGVKFHDGTPFNAAAVAFSVRRDLGINSGPAISLAGLKKVETPGPYTVVFVLSQPNEDFLPELSSPWGLMAVSPATVKAHATKSDRWAQKWMSSHDAGTGPYELTSYSQNGYTLKRYSGYWGPKAHYATVQIGVVPSFTSEVLQLQSGQINFMIKGVPPQELPSLQQSGFKVHALPNDNRVAMFVNPAAPAFRTEAGRNAIAAALNRPAMIKSVYGQYGSLAKQIFPAHSLPANLGVYPVKYNMNAAKKYVSSLPAGAKSITLQYIDDDPNNQRLALLISSALQTAGMKVQVSSVPQPLTFGYPTHPKGRPDLLIVDATSRPSVDAYSYPPSFLYHHAPLSYFTPTQTENADALMQAGVHQTTPAKAMIDYGKAAAIYARAGLVIPLADQPQVLVSQPGVTGFQHQFLALNSVELANVQPAKR